MEFNLDDRKILNGEVSKKEKTALENTLLEMFMQKATEKGKNVKIIRNKEEYDKLFIEGMPLQDYYLFIDEEEKVGDWRPVAYHLLHTDEGRFYAKILCC